MGARGTPGRQRGSSGAGIVLLAPALCCGLYALTLAGGAAATWAAVRQWWWLSGSALVAGAAAARPRRLHQRLLETMTEGEAP